MGAPHSPRQARLVSDVVLAVWRRVDLATWQHNAATLSRTNFPLAQFPPARGILMSLLKKRKPTPAQLAANRANARKCRGPKTVAGKRIVSLNALTDGRHAQPAARPLWQTMTVLGEDPGRFQALLQGFTGSYPPANPLELRLCEEITRLLLKAERNQRAQEAKLVRTYEKLESSRRKQQREIETSYDAPQAEVLETGLRRAPDSPGKFPEVMACLERLRKQVEARDFSDATELEALYGKKPTLRGAGIVNSFRELADHPGDRELLASLRLMVLEEMRDVAEDYQHYYQEHIEISRAMRLECLAPAGDREYNQLQRQEAVIRRQLERAVKLLISVQAAAARQTGAESRVLPADGLNEPLGWFVAAERGGGAGASPAVVGGHEGKLPAKTKKARALALRYKIDAPQPSGPGEEEQWEGVMSRVREIYGINELRSSPQPRSPSRSESGDREAEAGSAESDAAAPVADGPPEAAEKEPLG